MPLNHPKITQKTKWIFHRINQKISFWTRGSQKGGGGDVWEKFPNNPVFFLRASLRCYFQDLYCESLCVILSFQLIIVSFQKMVYFFVTNISLLRIKFDLSEIKSMVSKKCPHKKCLSPVCPNSLPFPEFPGSCWAACSNFSQSSCSLLLLPLLWIPHYELRPSHVNQPDQDFHHCQGDQKWPSN